MNKMKIAEMPVLNDISDDNLMIIEDFEDTKQSTVMDLKRAFCGDSKDPSSSKFYSSLMVSDLINNIGIKLSTLPTMDQLNYLHTIVDNIQKESGITTGEKDAEIVAARGSYSTLSDRLYNDIENLKADYIQFPAIEQTSMLVNLSDIDQLIATIRCPAHPNETILTISGKNKFNKGSDGLSAYTNVQVVNNGIKIIYTAAQNAYNIPLGSVLPAGTYALYARVSMSDNFVQDGTVLKLIHSDNSVTVVDYDYSDSIRFTVQKPIKEFQILPLVSTIVDGMWLELDNLMVSDDDSLDTYYPYCDKTYKIGADSSFFTVEVLYRCTIFRSEGLVNVKAKDTSYTGTVIKQNISHLESTVYGEEDHCGLLENRGEYIYTDGSIIINNENRCRVTQDKEKSRNGKSSAKITILDYNIDDPTSRFTLIPPEVLNLAQNKLISFQFYIDKTLSERFGIDDGIKIMLCSDNVIMNPASNYAYFNIGKNSFVQGWNTIKLKLSDFKKHGRPDMSNITQINFRIYTSEATNGMEFWLNSVIIDQKMKPTVLLALDGFYDESFDYAFPYLYTKGIPATVFANGKKTLTKVYMNKVATLKYQYGWELATDGCNPNKELMIRDDNARDQYLAVKETKQWLIDNFCSSIISYSAPFGNLRPITIPILRDLGYKIGKETADAYCSFFSKEDFAIPMHILSNSEDGTVDKVKAKIDEVVETGQTLCIYTGDINKFGSNIDASKSSFEAVVNHILKYVNKGKLQCLTFSDFYKKCVE